MPITSKQHEAIDWYSKHHNLKVGLSALPIITFYDKDKNPVGKDLFEIVKMYEESKTKERNTD